MIRKYRNAAQGKWEFPMIPLARIKPGCTTYIRSQRIHI